MNLELMESMMKALTEFPVIVLATIIQSWGSTPRKAGAKMIICPDGKTFGTIGGGCGEGEVKSKARIVMDTGVPVIHQVSMVGDVAADDGMVCGGRMEVYIEPIFNE